jgi:hypothetical protein
MKTFEFCKVIGVAGALAGLVAWPGTGQAQLGGVTDPVTSTVTSTTTDPVISTATSTTTDPVTSTATSTTTTVTGQAAAARATVFDLLTGTTTTVLADTGTLGGTTDAREASQLTGNVPSLLTGEVLHATTIGSPDQVASESSLAALVLSVAGITIGADYVMAEATALGTAAGSGTSLVTNLSINGVPVAVGADPNQIVYIPGGQVLINEQKSSPGSMVVNALHVIVDGVADVVIGSATAAIQ